MSAGDATGAARTTSDGRVCRVRFDGRGCDVPAHTSVAAALMTADRPADSAFAIFCGMGSCNACLVTVNGVHGVRACITPVCDGMTVETDGNTDG